MSDQKLLDNVVDFRVEKELSWDEISDKMSKSVGNCMLLFEEATLRPKDKIKAKTDEELSEKIAAARAEGLSWGKIMVRTGLGESRCRTLWEQASGESSMGNRVGKGGRYPAGKNPNANGDGESKAKPKAKAKDDPKPKAKAKKAAPKKAADKAGALDGITLEDAQAMVNGKTLTVKSPRAKTARKIGIKEVTKVKGDSITIVAAKNGATRDILIAHITAVSK